MLLMTVNGGNKYRHWNNRLWLVVDKDEDEMLVRRAENRRLSWMPY